jgi:hypothetical protein
VLGLAVAALIGYLAGHATGGTGQSDWMGLAIGMLLMLVAASAFEYGKRSAAPVVMLDAAVLARLAAETKP